MIVEIYVFYWRDIEIGIEIEMCLLKIWFLIELAYVHKIISFLNVIMWTLKQHVDSSLRRCFEVNTFNGYGCQMIHWSDVVRLAAGLDQKLYRSRLRTTI